MLPIRNLGRVRQVLMVAAHHGLGYLTDRLRAEPFFRFLRGRKVPAPPENIAAAYDTARTAGAYPIP